MKINESYNVQIMNIISKFFNSFDVKEWNALKDILSDQIECDYSDLRGDKSIVTIAEYISSRRAALDHLYTQHLYANVEIGDVKDKQVLIRVNAVIFRKNNDGRHFDSHVIYAFTLSEDDSGSLKIIRIKQSVLWHDGDPSIHKGIK